MERVDFQGTDISGVLDRLPDEDRNRLPFGVVKLDTQGTILAYNMAEAEISGVKVDEVVGKNFFLDVAVCTQRPEFYGRFRDAMDNDRVLNLIFDYEFQNALYAAVHEPIKVRVHMFSSYEIGGKKIVWLMVKRVGSSNRQHEKRAQVTDVAAQAAAQLGVPTLGAGSPMMPPSPAPWLSMPAASPPMPPQPSHAAQQPWQPQLRPAQPAFAPMPMQQQPVYAPMPMQQQPAYAPMPAQPMYAPAPAPANRPETNGADILIRFDDV
jgi:photoactive yellow protein